MEEIPCNLEVELCSNVAQARPTDLIMTMAVDGDTKICFEQASLDSITVEAGKSVKSKVSSCATSKKRSFAEISGGQPECEPISTKTRKLETVIVSVKASKTSIKEIANSLAEVSLDAVVKEPAAADVTVVTEDVVAREAIVVTD